MSTFKDLINVEFQDNTNYASFDSSDMLGLVLDYHWGPANQLLQLDRTKFNELFPESLPVGATSVDINGYYSYSQIKKAFDNGISNVEVYRLNTKWPYLQINFSGTDLLAETSSNQFNDSSQLSISLKYPGFIPQSMISGYDNLAITLSVSEGIINIKVCGVKNSNGSIITIEEFEGVTTPNTFLEGQDYSIESVVSKSQFISCKVNKSDISDFSESTKEFLTYASQSIGESFFLQSTSSDDVSNVVEVLTSTFADFEQSKCTLLISTFNDDSLNSTTINVASSRMDLNAIIGYPITAPFDVDSIREFRTTLVKDKFSFFVAGRETVKLFGYNIPSNCVGGWCGCTALVAKQVRINQLASAKTYGSYPGNITHSLSFNDVLSLHEEGTISVYKAFTGPQIFGVRSLHNKQNSYFGKANVMRVLAALLKQVFPVTIDVIHSDVASNPITRNIFQTTLNSIILEFIAKQNLKPQSVAICDENINTDSLTKGGTVLNIVLSLWFIGLVEKVNIKVVATDSSVTAEIV